MMMTIIGESLIIFGTLVFLAGIVVLAMAPIEPEALPPRDDFRDPF